MSGYALLASYTSSPGRTLLLSFPQPLIRNLILQITSRAFAAPVATKRRQPDAFERRDYPEQISPFAMQAILRPSTSRPTTLPARASPASMNKHDTNHSTHDLKSSSWLASKPTASRLNKSSCSTHNYHSHQRTHTLFLCLIKKSSCHVTIPTIFTPSDSSA